MHVSPSATLTEMANSAPQSSGSTRSTMAITIRLAVILYAVQCIVAAHASIEAVVTREASRFIRTNPDAMGVSIGVALNGQTLTFHFGRLMPDRATPPTDATVYPIASITKTFTGILLAQAVLERRAALDDDVRKFLSGTYANLEFQHHPIRLKDLLDHRSGLPFLLPDVPQSQPNFANNVTPWTARVTSLEMNYHRQDFFADLHKVVLDAIPGEKVSYSNAAAILMGYVLEDIYGKSFEALLRDRILQPLRMTHTAITQTPEEVSLTARGYNAKGAMMPEAPMALGAAAGMKSNITDMLTYAAWGAAEEDPAVRLAHAPVVTVAPDVTGLKYPYMSGLNWQEIDASTAHDTRRVIWQSGGMDGYASYCIEEPELHLAVVALFNEADVSSSQKQQAMINAILLGLDSNAVLLP